MIVAAIIVCLVAVAIGTIAAFVFFESPAGAIAGFIMSTLAVSFLAWMVHLGYSNPRDLTCYVDDKDRASRDGGSDMRIYTRECGVLKVQDLFWDLRFDSADMFSSIEPGHTYKIHVTGVRVEFFSVFPNVRSAERVA